MRTRFLLVAVLAMGLGAGSALGDKEKAKECFKKGMAEFMLNNYDAAITLFGEGFREEPEPVFLYNIAQAHRKAKRWPQAIEYYKKYLQMSPRAANRPEVEEHLANLAKALEEAASQPTKPVEAVAPPPVVTPPTNPEPPATTPKEPIVSTTTATTTTDNGGSTPVYKKWWLWTIVGVVVVGAVVGGAVAATTPNNASVPTTHYGNVLTF
jgi:hypothetical protein